jgi:hypothetical protein
MVEDEKLDVQISSSFFSSGTLPTLRQLQFIREVAQVAFASKPAEESTSELSLTYVMKGICGL